MAEVDPDVVARAMATEAVAADQPTVWFERLYVAANRGETQVPWDSVNPSALLVEWAARHQFPDVKGRALVVGCGLGRDAEYAASLGFDTVAFDVSETAVQTARERHPGSAVRYVAADLFDPPFEWRGAFDLVIESMTIQSLPPGVRGPAIPNVGAMIAPGGTLIAIAFGSITTDAEFVGPPWPLARAEVESFAVGDVEVVQIEDLRDAANPAVRRWRAEFHRPLGGLPA